MPRPLSDSGFGDKSALRDGRAALEHVMRETPKVYLGNPYTAIFHF